MLPHSFGHVPDVHSLTRSSHALPKAKIIAISLSMVFAHIRCQARRSKPKHTLKYVRFAATTPGGELVGLSRLELPTSPLSGVRSNHLSYRPILTGLFSLLLRCSLAYSVMYYQYTPSFARSAARTKQNILR